MKRKKETYKNNNNNDKTVKRSRRNKNNLTLLGRSTDVFSSLGLCDNFLFVRTYLIKDVLHEKIFINSNTE